MAHIVVDPITRIEGHLRVEIEVEGNKVTDAISSGTAWRGLEVIAKNRDPRDLWAYIQRICGVCTSSHSLGICGLPPPDVLGENSIAVLTCSGNIICSYCSISQYYLLYADFLSLIVLITKSNFIGISYITEVFITSKHA